MTTDGYRTPPEVLLLNNQLSDKTRECEDLRAEILELKERLAKAKRRDPQELRDAHGWWTWRIFWAFCAAVIISISYFIWRYNMKPEIEGTCREVLLADNDFEKKCPFAGQVQTAIGDRVKCACPTVAPAGSKP
jgi:hypothetical protein